MRSGGEVQVTDGNGEFRASKLAGRYVAIVSAAGCVSRSEKITLSPQQTTRLAISLDRSLSSARVEHHRDEHEVTVRGTVRDQSGAVIPHATVGVQREHNAATQASTDDTGRFEIALLPGVYAARVAATGFVSQEVTLTAVATREITSDFVLRVASQGYSGPVVVVQENPVPTIAKSSPNPTGELSGVVFDPVRAVVPNAAIQIVPLDSEQSSISPAITNAAGEFRSSLRPGRYRVTVNATGFFKQSAEVEVRDEQKTMLDFSLSVAHDENRHIVEQP